MRARANTCPIIKRRFTNSIRIENRESERTQGEVKGGGQKPVHHKYIGNIGALIFFLSEREGKNLKVFNLLSRIVLRNTHTRTHLHTRSYFADASVHTYEKFY